MEVKDIRRLLDALANSDVAEFTLETGEYKLAVRRGAHGSQQQAVAQAAAPVTTTPVQENVAQGAPEVSEQDAGKADDQGNSSKLSAVTAPIVGTFYSAPSPDAEPYVKVGDRVERGAVLCIIEAMKLMNEIEAESAGVVKEILVRNEEPVEYGQVLFRIDPR